MSRMVGRVHRGAGRVNPKSLALLAGKPHTQICGGGAGAGAGAHLEMLSASGLWHLERPVSSRPRVANFRSAFVRVASLSPGQYVLQPLWDTVPWAR